MGLHKAWPVRYAFRTSRFVMSLRILPRAFQYSSRFTGQQKAISLSLTRRKCSNSGKFNPYVYRSIHTSSIRNDRSFTNILADQDSPPPVQVASISEEGIQLSDGLLLRSACVFLEGKVFLWEVPQNLWEGWGPEHLELFEIVIPKPGMYYSHGSLLNRHLMIVRNTSPWNWETHQATTTVSPFVSQQARDSARYYGHSKCSPKLPHSPVTIFPHPFPQRNACSTYNLLSEEGRRVAAALLPYSPSPWEKSKVPRKDSRFSPID